MFETNFTVMDWWIVGIYLSASLLVGIVANRFIHNVKAYMIRGGMVSVIVTDYVQFIVLSVGMALSL